MREPRERTDRVRRRVEDHLSPLGAARVGNGLCRQSGTRTRIGEPLDLLVRCGFRLERPERRVALDVPLDVPGRDHLAGGERRAADDPVDVLRDRLLVPDPVLDGRDAARREGVRGLADRRLRVHRLRRDDPEVAGRQLRCVARRPHAPDDVARTAQTQAVEVDRVHVLAREVIGPHLDIAELREVGREEGSDGSAADDAHPHGEYDFSRALTRP